MTDSVATESTPTDSGTPVVPAAETTLITSAETPAAEQTNTEAPAEKPAAEAATEAKTKEPQGAPEEYADFTMPEGVTFDAELGGDIKAIAKELNLTQAQAQKLADLGLKHGQKVSSTHAEQLAQARETWANEAKADKEYGGEKFGENMAVAKKAVDAYASAELKDLLNQTGLGNHPEMIRLFHKVGLTISEDRFDGGRSTHSAGQQSAAQRLYGNTKT